jgi:uncharacterized protein YkwD
MMIEDLINKYSLHGNWVDLIFILLIIYFILTTTGFIDTFVDVIGFILAIFFSYKFYAFFGHLLVANFSLPKGLANASGFFIAWFIVETILFITIAKFASKFIAKFEKHPLNKIFGFMAATLQAAVIFLFFVSLIFAFPVGGQIKEAILQSRTGPYFVNLSQSFERRLKNIFGEAINETLNFITIRPGSEESLNLGVRPKSSQLSYNQQSENTMLNLVNQERTSRGIKQLVLDSKLRDLARSYGMEMFENGFFSHISAVNGSTPADRANQYGISYFVIGENLAYAPDVYVAHQGLMNSEGHRKNILSEDYGRVGMGVIDGGIYGKIFVQEFTN